MIYTVTVMYRMIRCIKIVPDLIVGQIDYRIPLFFLHLFLIMVTHEEMTQLPCIHLQGFPDVQVMPGDELIESLASSYSHVGLDETIVITRSNKRANIYNQGIRNTVLDREE